MTTTSFITSTYESIAAELTRVAYITNELLAAREIVRSRFLSTTDKDLTTVGYRLVDTFDKELAALSQAAEGFSNLLTTKTAESVEEKLGLGRLAGLVA